MSHRLNSLPVALLLFSALTISRPVEVRAAPLPPAKQGAELLKVDILGVFAHPDDETGVAPTLAYYALGRNKTVAHVYMTRGEGGGNMVGTQGGAALGLLREAELRDCLATLGIRYCYFLDQLDWAYTESLAATLRKWGKEETLGRLVRVVRSLRPDILLTMNPAPNPGQHGHHQAAGVLAVEAFSAAADPGRFPEQLHKEGLTIWQPRGVYFSGGGSNASAVIQISDVLPNGKTPGQIAAEALVLHRSQAFGNFSGATWLSRPQTFTLVKSMAGYPEKQTDLLALGAYPVIDRALIDRANRAPLHLAFVPRPAIASYQRWIEEQHIERIAGRFRADVPLVAGEANLVKIEISGEVPSDIPGRLRVQAPDNWKVEMPERVVRVSPDAMTALAYQITPPAGRPPDGELRATLEMGTLQATAVATGHPVPVTRAARARTPLALDGTDRGWNGIAAIPIEPTDVVQGRSTGPADSRAEFKVAHDGRTLFVDVQVADDHIVTNIAPNDIKGHWRSDSVEICIDPIGGVEDTMGSFKLGIFPFDSTGVVRAARDADANQGLVEETAPGTKLFSVRTTQGYRIQAAIPFSEIGLKRKRGQRIGFNLIIYDGDKVDAAPGENINKSRIAWSPRPGVQGRPEDWGRLELE